MSITRKDVEHVANLARLELTESEKEQFERQLSAILKYAEKLNELNTTDVLPTSHAMPLSNVMREDKSRISLSRDKVFQNAPEEEDDQFKVPAVIE